MMNIWQIPRKLGSLFLCFFGLDRFASFFLVLQSFTAATTIATTTATIYSYKNYSTYNNYSCIKNNKTNKNPQLYDRQQPATNNHLQIAACQMEDSSSKMLQANASIIMQNGRFQLQNAENGLQKGRFQLPHDQIYGSSSQMLRIACKI